jgi:hypothetical protein
MTDMESPEAARAIKGAVHCPDYAHTAVFSQQEMPPLRHKTSPGFLRLFSGNQRASTAGRPRCTTSREKHAAGKFVACARAALASAAGLSFLSTVMRGECHECRADRPSG